MAVMGLLVRLTGALLVAFSAGFFVFADHVSRLEPLDPAPRADGVVALTGGGGTRIAAGMSLLEAGHGARLLISGVHAETTDSDVEALTATTNLRLFDCCVDIDRRATTTLGNGRETAAWARARGYRSLIVVTSDFHMPRALMVLQDADPSLRLIPYPVPRNGDVAPPWWRDAGMIRRLAVEYPKYLAILAWEALRGPRTQGGDGAPSATDR